MRVGGGERDEEREVTTTQGVRGEEGDTILSYLHHHYS